MISKDCLPLRTGSIGNRDAETLINTLVEPKRSILLKLRSALLSQGYSEEAGYDAINIESYVSFSISNVLRFILKHKWELAVILVIQNQKEQTALVNQFPAIKERQFEQNTDDGTLWLKFDPAAEEQLILNLAYFYAQKRST